MDLYIFCVILGAGGMGAMAFLGLRLATPERIHAHDTRVHSIAPSHRIAHESGHAHYVSHPGGHMDRAAGRAKDAQLEPERVISDKQRELEQTKAANAALIG